MSEAKRVRIAHSYEDALRSFHADKSRTSIRLMSDDALRHFSAEALARMNACSCVLCELESEELITNAQDENRWVSKMTAYIRDGVARRAFDIACEQTAVYYRILVRKTVIGAPPLLAKDVETHFISHACDVRVRAAYLAHSALRLHDAAERALMGAGEEMGVLDDKIARIKSQAAADTMKFTEIASKQTDPI